MRDKGVREWVFRYSRVCNGNNAKRAQRVFIYGPSGVHKPFCVSPSFFLNAQNATFIKKLRFGLTKRIFWFSFFQNALFGLKKWKQTGTLLLSQRPAFDHISCLEHPYWSSHQFSYLTPQKNTFIYFTFSFYKTPNNSGFILDFNTVK